MPEASRKPDSSTLRQMVKDYGAVLVLVLAVVLLFGGRRGVPQLPEEAPAFEVTDLEGERFALASLRGSPVVLNFWASWCGPCRTEIPEFSAFAAAHPDVHVIGMAVQSGNRAEVSRAADSFGITYRVALANDELMAKYQVSSLPMTVIVDAEGKVKSTHVGTMDEDGLAAALR